MGIERFFSSIEKNDITNLKNKFTYKLEKKLNAQYLLIDFNSIVHITSTAINNDMNYLLYQILNNTFKDNPKFKQLLETYHINLDPNKNLEYEDLLNVVPENSLNDLILEKVRLATLNIIENFVSPSQLKYILIAADGVPHKSKMIEQKKRRFMGTLISKLKEKILQKHESELKNIQKRYIYETNKYAWSKINISPGTPYKQKMNKLLSSDEFKKEIKIICPNLKSFIYSGSDEWGEGEKKIVDYLHNEKNHNQEDKIAIYSPDSDMSLLCLLLSNYFKNISIIRHNQQQNNYDIIDIDMLRINLYNYVANSIRLNKKILNLKLDINSVIDDIVFILTIFGNDFLPKIESFSVKHDFTRIIDKYIKLLQEDLDKDDFYIVSFDKKKNKKIINQKQFTKIIKILHYDEGGNLQKVYLTNNYQNYEKLRKLLGVSDENFTQVLNDFLAKLRLFNYEVRNNKVKFDHWINQEREFITRLIKLTRFQNNIMNPTDPKEFIEEYLKFYENYNKLPEVRVTLKKFSKSLKSTHHREKLEKTLDAIDPHLKITKYDEEIFKLDNMLDEYTKKLNAYNLNLGYVTVDPKSYAWKTESIQDGVKRYYHDFFGINDINIKNPKMKSIVDEYIEGLVWVFDYYYNIKGNKPSIWFYKYTHAPLLTQIYYFIKDQKEGYLLNLQENLKKYEVNEKDYFKPTEHLMYVSAIQEYPEIIPNEYKNKVNKIKTIDINKIVNEIWTSQSSSEIDCRGVLFLNKCHIHKIHEANDILKAYEDDKKFLKILRS